MRGFQRLAFPSPFADNEVVLNALIEQAREPFPGGSPLLVCELIPADDLVAETFTALANEVAIGGAYKLRCMESASCLVVNLNEVGILRRLAF